MARNRSEKVKPEHETMLKTRDALRAVVKACLDAGYGNHFSNIHEGCPDSAAAPPPVLDAWRAYMKAESEWSSWDLPERPGLNTWPGVLRALEAYVKDKLDAS